MRVCACTRACVGVDEGVGMGVGLLIYLCTTGGNVANTARVVVGRLVACAERRWRTRRQ